MALRSFNTPCTPRLQEVRLVFRLYLKDDKEGGGSDFTWTLLEIEELLSSSFVKCQFVVLLLRSKSTISEIFMTDQLKLFKESLVYDMFAYRVH